MAEGKAKKTTSALVFSVQISPGPPSECQHTFWVEYVPTHAFTIRPLSIEFASHSARAHTIHHNHPFSTQLKHTHFQFRVAVAAAAACRKVTASSSEIDKKEIFVCHFNEPLWIFESTSEHCYIRTLLYPSLSSNK